MQLYVIEWLFQNAEDQLFATNEFCNYFREGMLTQNVEGFELKFIAHTPQNGSGLIICEADNISVLYRILKMWRESFSLIFNIKPALTNEELLSSHDEKTFWSKD